MKVQYGSIRQNNRYRDFFWRRMRFPDCSDKVEVRMSRLRSSEFKIICLIMRWAEIVLDLGVFRARFWLGMIVSDDFVFVHIPKTRGTFVNKRNKFKMKDLNFIKTLGKENLSNTSSCLNLVSLGDEEKELELFAYKYWGFDTAS